MRGDEILFDRPGPRARRRIAVATALVVLVALALAGLAVYELGAHGQLAGRLWRPFGTWPIQRFLFGGMVATAEVTLACAVIAMPAGALIALARLSRWSFRLGRVRVAPVRWVATGYTELFRSVPTLLLIYLFLLGLPPNGINLPTFWKLAVPICLTGSATIAEVFRAGILALERGQTEAAYAIGMRYWQTLRLIVLPQVIRPMVPLLLVQLINLLKDTTLGYVVSYTELTYSGKILSEYVHAPMQTYLAVAVLYVVLNFLISRLALAIAHRQGRLLRFRVNPFGRVGVTDVPE